MLRHIVMWNYKDGLSESEKNSNAQKIKSMLEQNRVAFDFFE